jgi:predicted anti-sigma-YlaC factor YlaD
MTHERARAELSAGLDGEQLGEVSGPVADHLASCVSCRQWQQAAELVTAKVRQAPPPAGSDRTEQLLAAVLADQMPRRRPRPGRYLFRLRAALGAVAAAQLVLIVPSLVLGNAGAGASVHASHELGAFELAVAVGFVLAAVRPSFARGMLPLVAVASATLIVLAFVDTAFGYTTLPNEAPHLITLLGALLLYAVIRVERASTRSGPEGHEGRGPGSGSRESEGDTVLRVVRGASD